MPNRIWSNPPLKPDGSLDYGQFTLAETCEDLTETLLDLVYNGGMEEFVPFLNDIPALEDLPSIANSPPKLVRLMEELRKLEGTDPHFQTPKSRRIIDQAVLELGKLADKTV